MPTYLALVDVESPEPLLVKVRAASLASAEALVMKAFDLPSKSRVLGVWDVAQVQDVRELLPRREIAGRDIDRDRRLGIRRRPGDDVTVRGHVRRK